MTERFPPLTREKRLRAELADKMEAMEREHARRVTELLAANNRYLETARGARQGLRVAMAYFRRQAGLQRALGGAAGVTFAQEQDDMADFLEGFL